MVDTQWVLLALFAHNRLGESDVAIVRNTDLDPFATTTPAQVIVNQLFFIDDRIRDHDHLVLEVPDDRMPQCDVRYRADHRTAYLDDVADLEGFERNDEYAAHQVGQRFLRRYPGDKRNDARTAQGRLGNPLQGGKRERSKEHPNEVDQNNRHVAKELEVGRITTMHCFPVDGSAKPEIRGGCRYDCQHRYGAQV